MIRLSTTLLYTIVLLSVGHVAVSAEPLTGKQSAHRYQTPVTVLALLARKRSPAGPHSVWRVDDSCKYGYGSCGQWSPSDNDYCSSGYRPCFEEGYSWCKWFPECN